MGVNGKSCGYARRRRSISAANMRDHAFTVTGDDVDAAAKVNGSSKQWLITVDPDGNAAVTITLAGNQACTTTGAICTDEDDPVQLGNSPSATVAKAAGTPLTASFANLPATHTGADFTFDLAFTDELDAGWQKVKAAFQVTGGSINRATRKTKGSDLNWKIKVRPRNATDSLTITLPATLQCSANGAICTDDGRRLSNTTTATVATEAEEEAASTPTVSIAGGNGTEGTDSSIRFTVTLDAAAAESVTVDYATSDGTATAGDDYTSTSGTLTFSAGTTSQTVSVPIADDETDERDETFTVTLSNASGADLGTSTATGTIRNRSVVVETTPTVGIAGGNGTEGTDSSITFTVTLDEAASGTVTVDYATSDGTATAGDDYTSASGTLTFSAGTTSQSVSVPIADDEENESDETFTVTLSNASGADLGTSSSTGTIKNRLVVLPKVSISGGSGKEGDDSSISFTVTLDKAASGTVTVAYATADGTADAGDDYTATSGTLTFSAGTTSQTVAVEIADDIVNEGDETFTVTLSNPSGADLGTNSATGTIENRYVEPLTARFENMPSEHDGSEITFELHFSENPELPYERLRDRSFTLVQADVTRAAQRQNPQATNKNQSWTITVKPLGTGQIGITLPAAVSCTDDKSICTSDGRKLSHSASATVLGPVGISIGDAEVVEGAGAVLAFAVTLTRAATSSLTVDYSTSDGTATAGDDYTSTSGTLIIGAGSSSGSIDVAVLDDEHNEGSETLTMTLSNASAGTLTNATATGTITNHDALPAALTARFGRAAAVHVLEQVEERVNAPRAPGFDGRFAGRRIDRNMGRDFALEVLQGVAGSAGMGPGRLQGGSSGMTGLAGGLGTRPEAGFGLQAAGQPGGGGMDPRGGLGPMGGHGGVGGFGMGVGGRDQVLGGSSFALNREAAGGSLGFWSRSASSSFAGRKDALALGGDVRTTMFGADYSRGRMITGVSLSHSRGIGTYAGDGAEGQVASAVTGLYPWIRVKPSEHVTL